MKITFIVAVIGLALLIAGLMGCSSDTVGTIEKFYISNPEKAPAMDAIMYYPNNIKVSVTDAPLEHGDLEKVHIKFSRIEVSMGDVDDVNAEWIPINEEGGMFNLLELTNGTCQTLALAKLGIGQYHQTRFEVSEVTVEENMLENPVHLDSEKITIGKQFSVKEGRMTNLVLDFDAKRSLHKMDSGWVMTPVIRFVERYNTGAILGEVIYPADLKATGEITEVTTKEDTEEKTEETTEEVTEEVTEVVPEDKTEDVTEETEVKATVTAFKDGETESYSSTIVAESGRFILGYLEAGLYDIEIKAGAYDEYFFRVEDVEVVIGEVVDLGELEVTLFAEKKPILNTITVNVSNIEDIAKDGTPIYVSTFPAGVRISNDNVFEMVKGEKLGDGYITSITMDNGGEGYEDGTYGVRVHIDLNRDCILTAEKGKDFVAVGEATVSGGSTNVEINGPWGTYFSLILANQEDVSPVKTGRMYLTLVSQGDTWGNYAYGEANFESPLGYRGIASWAPPNDTYDFLVFIDTDGNMADTGGPDPGDWEASQSIIVSDGLVTDPPGGVWLMTVNSWLMTIDLGSELK